MTTYSGRVWIDHWHDGDTPYGIIDPGWNITLGGEQTTFQRIRIAGIDAPELTLPDGKTPNQPGLDALAYAQRVAPEKAFYDYVGHNRDKYGRPLLDITLKPVAVNATTTVSSFALLMLTTGHAVKMN